MFNGTSFFSNIRYLEYQIYGISNTKYQEQNMASMLIGALHQIMEFFQLKKSPKSLPSYLQQRVFEHMDIRDNICILRRFLFTYRDLVSNLKKCFSRIGDQKFSNQW